MDDVLNVSGHRMGTAEIESAMVAHDAVAEAAAVGYPHDIKGEGIYVYVTLQQGIELYTLLKGNIYIDTLPFYIMRITHRRRLRDGIMRDHSRLYFGSTHPVTRYIQYIIHTTSDPVIAITGSLVVWMMY